MGGTVDECVRMAAEMVIELFANPKPIKMSYIGLDTTDLRCD
jgi:hypothetical protein